MAGRDFKCRPNTQHLSAHVVAVWQGEADSKARGHGDLVISSYGRAERGEEKLPGTCLASTWTAVTEPGSFLFI